MRTKVTVSAIAVMSMVLSSAGNPARGAFFMGLGDLPGGVFQSVGSAISADGTVVVGVGFSESGEEAFRWTRSTGMVGLGNVKSHASDVSADGSVVVGHHYGQVSDGKMAWQAFRWTQSEGMVGLSTSIFPDRNYGSIANGVSADGSTVVGYMPATPRRPDPDHIYEAVRWVQGGAAASTLGQIWGSPQLHSEAYDVSADGSVIVGRGRSSRGHEAFIWTQQTNMKALGYLSGGSGNWSEAYGVSGNGRVVVGRSDSPFGMEAFRWTEEEGMVGLGDFPGGDFYSNARAVSNDGSVIVGNATSDKGSVPFLWTQSTGMRPLEDILAEDLGLNLEGWVLGAAMGISADGSTIVGTAFNPAGNYEAFIANIDPVPLPGAVWLLGSGLVGLVGMRKRLLG